MRPVASCRHAAPDETHQHIFQKDTMSDNLTKLSRVLGMLGSQHDGEVLNAARLAERIRNEMNLSWGVLLMKSATPNNEAEILHLRSRAIRAETRAAVAETRATQLEARVASLETIIRNMQATRNPPPPPPGPGPTYRRTARVADKYYLAPNVESELVAALQEKWCSHHKIYAITNWPRAWLKVQLGKIARKRRLVLETRDAYYGKGFIYRFVART